MRLTDWERNELTWAKHAKMIRVAVYDVGILLGAILLADTADESAGIISNFWSGKGSINENIIVFPILIMWVFMIVQRYRDWHSVDRLERGLERDEIEREDLDRY